MLTVILLAAMIPLLLLGLDPLQWEFLETTLGIKRRRNSPAAT
jgi:hypothetical protein